MTAEKRAEIIKNFDREKRESDYVCVRCGVNFLTDKQKGEFGVHTFHQGECGVCKETNHITSIRHYNWLHKPKQGGN